MSRCRRFYPCCLLLFALGCGKSTADWAEQAKAPDPVQRPQSNSALEARGGEDAAVVPVLAEALKDENTHVRRDAARALRKLGSDAREAVPVLIARLRDKEPSVRKAAAQALKDIDPAVAAKSGVK